MRIRAYCLSALIATTAVCSHAAEPRSETHTEYAKTLWDFVTKQRDYTKWQESAPLAQFDFAPPADSNARAYLNAAARLASQPHGAVVVTEHRDPEGEAVAVTICVRARDDYDSTTGNWYWAHYLADGTTVKTSVDKSPHPKRGFVTFMEDGRLWVFSTNSDQLGGYLDKGELAKHVIRPGAGPGGITIKSPDAETIDAYLTAKAGYVTFMEDGRLWVFKEGAEELAKYKEAGDLAKHVIRPGAGPGGITVKAPDGETIDAYLTSQPGFVTFMEDGRLWVFKEGSEELAKYKEAGDLAKHVIRPGAGPGGITVKGSDAETLDAYLSVAVRP